MTPQSNYPSHPFILQFVYASFKQEYANTRQTYHKLRTILIVQSDSVYIMFLLLYYRQCECEYFVACGTGRAAKLWCQHSHREA
jgi:hypothetical protein